MKNKNLLLSCSKDNKLSVWSMQTYQRLHVINDVNCYWTNTIYQIDKDRVIIGGRNIIYIVNIENSLIEKNIKGSKLGFVLSFIKLREHNTILCGCEDGKLVLYNYNTNKGRIIQSPHNLFINDLLNIDDHTFISCSTDATIKIWNY